MYKFFEAFIQKMKASFHRIAKATKHDVSVDDLQNDAWIIAHEIGKRRGREVNFADPADQDLVIRTVNAKNVKRGDWKMRNAIRIDQEPDDDESMPRWSDKLAARDSSDPLISLLLRESALNAETVFADSYSQAVAYVKTFVHFKNNRQAVCDHLAIATSTLTSRVTFAAQTVRIQPSIFDRVEKISETFTPLIGRHYAPRVEQQYGFTQLGWEF